MPKSIQSDYPTEAPTRFGVSRQKWKKVTWERLFFYYFVGVCLPFYAFDTGSERIRSRVEERMIEIKEERKVGRGSKIQ